jgi:hypothetical protein
MSFFILYVYLNIVHPHHSDNIRTNTLIHHTEKLTQLAYTRVKI